MKISTKTLLKVFAIYVANFKSFFHEKLCQIIEMNDISVNLHYELIFLLLSSFLNKALSIKLIIVLFFVFMIMKPT